MSWNPTPSWSVGWENRWDLIKAPLKVLEHWYAGWFLATSLYAFACYATYMHTKSALAMGAVALVLAPVLYIAPELRWLSYLGLVFGAASVLWEFARKYVMSR